jgi:hypothetical protein
MNTTTQEYSTAMLGDQICHVGHFPQCRWCAVEALIPQLGIFYQNPMGIIPSIWDNLTKALVHKFFN